MPTRKSTYNLYMTIMQKTLRVHSGFLLGLVAGWWQAATTNYLALKTQSNPSSEIFPLTCRQDLTLARAWFETCPSHRRWWSLQAGRLPDVQPRSLPPWLHSGRGPWGPTSVLTPWWGGIQLLASVRPQDTWGSSLTLKQCPKSPQ